jgi:hypothetical protein
LTKAFPNHGKPFGSYTGYGIHYAEQILSF